ncbi:hypothetical protein CSE16_10865 [Solibacillus sp. R5-41]|uniref:hypothetical protein n=1 Tax=Solibacillus sp. R5-41 TaxID=2048654 RepID=UPI000C12948A|nr:hypothetical protein [Solibacillus sp. R5-41]ATP40508.1 hypothetical protein CSE16_10865 [Solibacillus sp. R5-41]
MYWESLPKLFWIIYYLFLITTLGTAIFNVIRMKMISLSVITIVFTVSVPIISFANSIGREKGVNEFEHLVTQLQQGSFWSIFVIIAFLYLLVWWGMFLIKNVKKEVSY